MRFLAATLLLCTLCGTDCTTAQSPKRIPSTKAPRGIVTGTAYCADTNMPARRAAIILVPASGADMPHMLASTTDLEGRFTITGIPEGNYYVSSLLAGYLNPLSASKSNQVSSLSDEERKELESHVTKVTVIGGETTSASIRLERAAEIDGTVLYDDGSPAIGLQIYLRQKSPSPQKPGEEKAYAGFLEYADQRSRVTDDHGHFRLLGLAPGEYLVNVQVPTPTATGNGTQVNLITMALESSSVGSLVVYYGDTMRASVAKTIKIEGGESFAGADITIPLQKLHTLRGRVILKRTGQPPPTATLRLLFADTRETARVGLAVNGEFTIPYVPEDSFVLQAMAQSDSLPNSDIGDGDAGLGIFWASDQDEQWTSVFDERGSQKPDGTAEIPLAVQNDMDAIVLEAPDPSASKSTSAASKPVSAPQ